MTESEYREVLWTSRMPLVAAARVGKVHLYRDGEYETLCGLRIPRPSLQFSPNLGDKRCSRCRRKATST